ncbi:reticulon-4b isoform X1 [Tachysurus fulvidraco]|uniref:reticulon-4b isoform X1 n=1 Tax=Tachysurus fulvidraco TaxID=1234273 RepID=UPI001FEE5B93|nr:reticulon-4b isoform X1 [Tachysurus fulvidraco]
MADTEQVSSTTPNEVEEDKMKPWTESAWSATTDKELFQDEGLFGVKQDVQNVREAPVEAAGEVSRQEETEKENKECLEKSVGLVSNPVECESPEEPDSTQMEDTGDQEPVVSSAAELHNAFRSEELQELRTKPQEELFFESDHETQEEDFGFNSSVKVEAFSAPVEPEKAVSSVVEEKKEPERRTLLEESFGADSESTPASPASPSAHEPSLPSSAAASFQNLMQYTSEYEDLSLITNTQPSFKTTMDAFANDPPSRSVTRYDPDVLNQSDDDLMFETKRNPFQDFSPVEKAASEFSAFAETTADIRASKMSDSPSPDLVQNAHELEPQDSLSSQDYEQSFDSREAATESLRQQLASSDFFGTGPKANEESGLPPSLPDILKSSPRNQDKADSGSSEGSPDFSPVHRSGNESPNAPFSLSANNPFTFEAKVPLVKEMAEETEAKAAGRGQIEKVGEEEEEKASEQMFGTFDLVKEAEVSPKGTETIIEEQDDFQTLSQDTAQVFDKFECLSFPTGKAQEHSDSESPSADSLSPVLEAMAKNPASFQMEPEKNVAQEETEATDEISEQEVSSEEFEFVEKPPRGAIDDFLETLENPKASELADDDEDTAKFEEQVEEPIPAVQETKNQSYFLLTESSNETSPARGKAGLELSDFQVPSQAPRPPSPVITIETVAVRRAEPKDLKLPNLNAGSVMELLYWRDLKNSGIVFGASLLLLLSLSVCSIISVLSYVALAFLSVTISFRIYKGVLQAIQKSDEGHPFKLYLEQEVSLPDDVVRKYSDVALGRVNTAINELRRLFLVEDLVDSLKFAVLMWILTYVGALFNGLTLLILGLVAMFTCPVVYEKHQAQIDHYVALVRNHVKDVVGKVQAKIPGAKKKEE